MTDSVAELRDRLRPSHRRRPPQVILPATAGIVRPESHSFAVENGTSGRVVIATPIETAAKYRASDFYMDVRGRLVEAEHANGNGAFWTHADLEFGLPSVAYGPLNWGHDAKDIVGTLLDPVLVSGEQAAAAGVGPHIQTGARFWSYLSPERARLLNTYVEEAKAYFSMECISEQIQCVGPNGCGQTMPYVDAQTRSGAACVHVKERASFRRFVNPIFQAAAVIVPPQHPGWSAAQITGVVTAAEQQVEAAEQKFDGLTDEEAVAMVASILSWSNKV